MYLHTNTLLTILRQALLAKPFSMRHAALAVLFAMLFLTLRTIVYGFRLLDLLLYPDFRRMEIKAPIYIIGNPRSGTTFTHRLLAGDERFTYFQLWQTILPAVSLYKLVGTVARLDKRIGRPLGRLVNKASDAGLGGWEKMHATGPTKAESDEMLFMYACCSPLLTLMFPYFGELKTALFADSLPPAEREKLKAYFVDCLKRHVYATRDESGQPKILLEKVAMIAGRLELVLEALPDARVIHLVRDPERSVPSLLSMHTAPWPALAPQHAAPGSQARRDFKAMVYAYYLKILHVKKAHEAQGKPMLEVRYEDLVADPKAAAERVYAFCGLDVPPNVAVYLDFERDKARAYVSKHDYGLEDYGLTREELAGELKEFYDEYGYEE